MALYYGVNAGAGLDQPTFNGSTSTGKDIEVVVNSTSALVSTQEIHLALQKLWDFILKNGKTW